jgi:thiol-disulfide isomerase/thioredoxin
MNGINRTVLGVAVLVLAGLAGCGGDDSDGSNGGSAGSGGAAGQAGTGGEAGLGGTGGTGGMAGEGGAAGAGAGATGGSGGSETGGAGGTGGGEPQTRMTISGDATWTVTFDADAQAQGATNCQYTRHYEGVQDQSRPWVCAECEVIFRTTVTMPVGLNDCFKQVSEYDPAEEEWIGYGNGTWYRSYGIGASGQGTAVVTAGGVTYDNEVKDLDADVIGAGKMEFTIAGTFTTGQEDGDPNHGWVAPATYACSWDKADPPAYTGPYTLEVGATLPDGVFRDACDEPYRIHDAKGAYILISMSAIDCPACRSMAAEEHQFVEDMKAAGIDVVTITLMAPSLDDPFGDTSKSQLEYWRDKYAITTPIVADRGLGVSMFLPIYEDQLGYPSWVVADPDLKVLRYGTGVDWFTIQNTITLDAKN